MRIVSDGLIPVVTFSSVVFKADDVLLFILAVVNAVGTCSVATGVISGASSMLEVSSGSGSSVSRGSDSEVLLVCLGSVVEAMLVFDIEVVFESFDVDNGVNVFGASKDTLDKVLRSGLCVSVITGSFSLWVGVDSISEVVLVVSAWDVILLGRVETDSVVLWATLDPIFGSTRT